MRARVQTDRGNAPIFPVALGQLISWGTLYYGITFLALPIRDQTGWGLPTIFAAYSAGLLVAALMAAPVGRLLRRYGGRTVMVSGFALAALAFLLLAVGERLSLFFAAWLLAGLAMSMSLYEAAFSALSGRPDFRKAIGMVTLVGGFASTLFWPLTHGLVLACGWRDTALVFAALNAGGALLLFLSLPRARSAAQEPARPNAPRPSAGRRRTLALLAFAFAMGSLVSAAVSAHAGVLLGGPGLPDWQLLLALSLIGPLQVAGRLLEWRLSHRVSVRTTGLLAFATLALGLATLGGVALLPGLVFVFALLYGTANGVLTVVRGGAPAEMLEGLDYATALGLISTPALLARAVGPQAAALLLPYGQGVTVTLLLSAALLGLLAFRLLPSSPGAPAAMPSECEPVPRNRPATEAAS